MKYSIKKSHHSYVMFTHENGVKAYRSTKVELEFWARIQELELALTEIATRTRLSQKKGGAVQQVLSAEQMVEIAEKALNPPQQQQPKLPHTNQDQIPLQNPEPHLLD